jgi:protein FAM50
MAEYKGGAGDASRIRQLEKKREAESAAFQTSLDKMKADRAASMRSMSDKFATSVVSLDEQLRSETMGLVTLDTFKRKREDLELEGPAIETTPVISKKRKEKVEVKLSFDEEEEDQDIAEPVILKKKLLKDPSVDTSFLPDAERDERERQERLKLKREWKQAQERIKAEKINITYSYYDGAGHRRSIVVTKGTTVEEFLSQVRKEFKELRNVSTDNLMFIKEDLIIPMHYSFYELIETKARGKSGPLFYWDVHDDIRLTADASVEKEESHAAKVVERRWYESNKHAFPMNRWEIFDPSKNDQYTKYTIKDGSKPA